MSRTLTRRLITAIFVHSAASMVPTVAQASIRTALENDPSDYINESLQESGSVTLPCGIFVVHKSIKMPSGSSLTGAGKCTVLKASPTLSPSSEWSKIKGASAQVNTILTNDNFVTGNSDISISNLTFDASEYSRKGHILGFYKAANVTVSHVQLIGGRNPNVFDGTAFVNSRNYNIMNNTCQHVKTACFDNWGGDSDVVIAENTVEGLENFSSYGILINGINTDDTMNISKNIRIVGNKISLVSQGIFVGGLRMKNGQHGKVSNILIEQNIVNYVDYHGIRVSDGNAVIVRSNSVGGAGRNCLVVGSEGGGGITDGVFVITNRFSECAFKDPGSDAVTLYSGASNVTFQKNVIMPGNQRYSIRVDSTVSNSIIDVNDAAKGRVGVISNSGHGVNVVTRQ